MVDSSARLTEGTRARHSSQTWAGSGGVGSGGGSGFRAGTDVAMNAGKRGRAAGAGEIGPRDLHAQAGEEIDMHNGFTP